MDPCVCPFTIRASTKPRVHRVPNVVGVGFAKCGTGTLAFLGELILIGLLSNILYSRKSRGDSMIWDFTGRRPLSVKDYVVLQ